MNSFLKDFNDGNGEVYAHYHLNGGGTVSDTAKVNADAFIESTAMVYGNAWIDGTCKIYNNSKVYGNSILKNNVELQDNVEVFGTAMVENILIYGDCKLSITPKIVLGFDHPVVITDTHIILGCQNMTFDYWKDHGKAIIKVNGYPTRTVDKIYQLIDSVRLLHSTVYSEEDLLEAFKTV